MIAAEDVTLVLLAGGRSERFGGTGSKLDEDFLGLPLGLHVARTLRAIPFASRVAVTGTTRIDYAAHSFHVLRNEAPEEGMARSVRLGIAHAKDRGAQAVLLVLADMPRVTAAHVHRLLNAADGPGTIVASSDGGTPKPPAIFGRDRFDELLTLEGDAGARAMIRAARHVVAKPADLIDIDTAEDLARLRGWAEGEERNGQ